VTARRAGSIGEWAGVVLLSRASGSRRSDIDALVPFAREAQEALTSSETSTFFGDTSEAHAVRKNGWWVTGVIAVRELGVTALRFWVLRHGVIAASRGGKLKTLVQSLAIGCTCCR